MIGSDGTGLDHATGELGRRHEESVVRSDEAATVSGGEHDRTIRRADAAVDDADMNTDREVADRVRQRHGAGHDGLGLDAVRHVNDPDAGCAKDHDALDDAGELVLKPEIGQEGDDTRHGTSLPGRRSGGVRR